MAVPWGPRRAPSGVAPSCFSDTAQGSRRRAVSDLSDDRLVRARPRLHGDIVPVRIPLDEPAFQQPGDHGLVLRASCSLREAYKLPQVIGLPLLAIYSDGQRVGDLLGVGVRYRLRDAVD